MTHLSAHRKQTAAGLLSALRQAVLLLVISLLAAVATNALRADVLPWLGSPPPPEAPISTAQSLPAEQALALWTSGQALFVDARSAEAFTQGHVPDALNMPYTTNHAELDALNVLLPRDQLLVIYCDGESCPLSHKLADYLSLKGHENLFVMQDGVSGWQAAGGPLEAAP